MMQLYSRPVVGLELLPALLLGLFAVLSESASCQAATEAAHNYRDKSFDYFVVGDPALPRAAHTEFGLALMGGGGYVDAAYRFIASHGGGGHMLVLRAVSDDIFDPEAGDYGASFRDRWGPVRSAETIVFHAREAAFDPRVLAALRRADGIFLAGGDQANYIRYWKGTPVEAALNAHVRAHRPIGGSSAGLAILGHFSYTSLDGGSMESKTALANPYDAGMTLEDNFLHLRWLESVITDTHFSQRCRLGRSIAFVARLNQEHPAAHVFGVGIDERSAMLIGADGIGRLAENSAGSVWIIMPQRQANLVRGEPLSVTGLRIVRLDGGSDLDFNTRRVGHAASEAVINLERGVATQESIATPILMRGLVPPHEG
jgi:cyanophycinase